ncbi:MAG: hypothetical protein GXO69_06305 [Acidobacteria bacterium]|nr:hypothetical protein [Acidobacteriota bacterium]
MKKFLGLAAVFLCATFALSVRAGVDCTECHGEDGEPAINISVFQKSVHGDLSCTDCHVGADKDMDNHPDNLKKPSCTDCHEDQVESKQHSVHKDLSCTDCHGDIHTLDPDKPIEGNAKRITAMCGKCHAGPSGTKKGNSFSDLDLVKKLPPTRDIIKQYHQSAHYLKKNKDGSSAATCADCHGSHDILSKTNPKSTIYKLNISHTCGQCHKKIAKEYDRSIHGKAVQQGWDESPSCVDCHNSHLILSVDSPEALTNKRRLSEKICLSCHEDQRLIQRYSLVDSIGSSYHDSYHSMANERKGSKAATCIDCHTTHDILKPSNPNSSVNPAHVAHTCSQCHKGATEKFALSYDHKSSLKSGNIINYYVRISYIWLILMVIGGMFLHNMLIYISSIIRRYRERNKEKLFPRLTKGQMILHGVNFLAFFTLVATGFSLRFSDVPVLHMLTVWLSEGTRALIHRIAGVTMILIFGVHFFRIATGHSDRGVFLSMLPRLKDIRDFKDNMKYLFLRTEKRPNYGKTTYAEKMEYLALLWGTLVMALTGLILWFPTEALRFLPAWSIKVAETVHFYEAILATMAIFFWHFFFVILNPDVYPLDLTVVDGKMPIEEIKEHRPDWYEELKEKGKID